MIVFALAITERLQEAARVLARRIAEQRRRDDMGFLILGFGADGEQATDRFFVPYSSISSIEKLR